MYVLFPNSEARFNGYLLLFKINMSRYIFFLWYTAIIVPIGQALPTYLDIFHRLAKNVR